MIDLYFWTTPNGRKITIFLEEAELPYTLHPINIGKGEQFASDYLKIAPNNKIPAIVDHTPFDGGPPISIFESGAILHYLASKTGQFMPRNLRGQIEAMEWLMWQMSAVGPMFGQSNHFSNYASEKIPYAIERYQKEVRRLCAVLDRRLIDRTFIADTYSIADMATYAWLRAEHEGVDMNEFPNVQRWKQTLAARPEVERAYAKGKELSMPPAVSDAASRKILFGQDASVVKLD
jgi:GST-like protein